MRQNHQAQPVLPARPRGAFLEEPQMDRRAFVQLLAGAAFMRASGGAPQDAALPKLRAVSAYTPAKVPGMPGPYPGTVVSVASDRALDTQTNATNAEVAREMMARGMCALTGTRTPADAWKQFFVPDDIVGLKVNCGGHPYCVSDHAIVAETIRQLMAVGIPPAHIYIYERFQTQLDEVNYAPRVAEGVQIAAAERANRYADNSGYDPATYLEADLFGEEDTRSNLMTLVSQRLTKIVNIPNMKDHGAAGATGCLKNIAYGSFSNVARTHLRGTSHTLSFIGTLASIEPLRSRTVLQIMDGLRAVWHGGPFARTTKYVFYPKRILFGTDPVAIDRLLLDIIDDKRKAEGAISIWDRSPASLRIDDTRARDNDPNVNIITREPGHVEFASTLGLGVYDKARIRVQEIQV
ncbi:MAG TPA: DUF362 domain-containing protein [Vicinamibacterales bacterium]|nr:DUF362 domain-containing protein [Vicinamibacterales bacterium]